MKIRVPKLTLRFAVLYLGLSIYMLRTLLNASSILFYNDILDNVMFGISVIAFVAVAAMQRYDNKRILAVAAIAAFALLTGVLSGRPFLLLTILVCVAIKDIDFDKVVGFLFRITFVFMIIHTVLSVAMPFLFERALLFVHTDGLRIRYAFGFIHPNSFSIFLFNLILMWVWLNYERIKYKHIVIIFITGVLAFIFSDTRTSFVLLIFLCMMLILDKWIPKFHLVLSFLAKGIVPVLSILVFIMIRLFLQGNLMVIIINSILLNRIRLGAFAYYNWGLSLFGQNLQNVYVGWDPVSRRWTSLLIYDNIYSFFMVEIGIIWLIVVTVLFYFLATKGSRRINLCIIIWAAYGMTEVHGWNGFILFPFLFFTFFLGRNQGVIAQINNSENSVLWNGRG